MKIHTILILAGGDGDRFAPLQDKMRYEFNGKTVLQHIATGVAEFAEHVIVVTSNQNKNVIESDLSKFAVEYVVQTKSEGGMADAILAAEKKLSSDVLILNANDIFDFSIIPNLVTQTKSEGSRVGIVAKHVTSYFPGGYVVFKDDKAVALNEKPTPDATPSEYVRLVVDYFPNAALFIDELKKSPSSDSQNENAMSNLMAVTPATCLKYEGDWATLKYSWHVLSMQDYFFTHQLQKSIDASVHIHSSAVIEGGVCIGKNVKIGAFTKIMGPCYIGENTIIGDHCLVRGSAIGRNVLIGSGCEVARSYLGNEVMLHRNYVGDSVLADGVSMGAGAVTSNYRFDSQNIKTPIKGTLIDSQKSKFGLIAGKDVRIGVNVSTYPGVKLAAGTKVLPGEVVTKDR